MLNKQFLYYFRSILTRDDKKSFIKYMVVLFIGSISSVFGIGAVLPFISILIEPEKITSISFLQDYTYHALVVASAVILISAFWIKNAIATYLLFYQSKYLGGFIWLRL